MFVPRLYFGTHRDGAVGEGRVLLADRTMTDDGTAYPIKATSVRAWMAGGPKGEALLKSLALTLVFTVNGTIKVTPIVDNRELTDAAATLTLAPNPGERTVQTFILPVLERTRSGSAPVQGVRGAALQVKIEGFGIQNGVGDDYILAIDECEAEVEIVRSAAPVLQGVTR